MIWNSKIKPLATSSYNKGKKKRKREDPTVSSFLYSVKDLKSPFAQAWWWVSLKHKLINKPVDWWRPPDGESVRVILETTN